MKHQLDVSPDARLHDYVEERSRNHGPRPRPNPRLRNFVLDGGGDDGLEVIKRGLSPLALAVILGSLGWVLFVALLFVVLVRGG